MNKESNLSLMFVWILLLMILTITTNRVALSSKLDKIENNTKEIIEILRNGDV